MELYMDLPSEDKVIKKEPFEEFLFPETILQPTDNLIESCCFLCDEGKEIVNAVKEHYQAYHPDIFGNSSDSDFCNCSEGLKLQTKLVNHLLFHLIAASPKHENIELETEKNFEEISEEPSIAERRLKHHKSKKFQCSLCPKFFSFKQGLQKHCSNEHNPANANRIKYQRQENSEATKISCELCPKTFKYRQGLTKHFDLEHNPSNTFSCTKCSSRCKTLKNLHAHLRTHEPPREDVDSLQCHKCLKIFPSLKQLTLHLYTHREKFFSCDKCGAKFNNREQVKNHVMRHVGLFNKKSTHQKIICDQCSMLVYSYKMKRHKIVHHSDEKPFKCDIGDCNAAFSDKRILLDHQNIHLNLKPYKCEHCPEAFRSGANLRLHRLRHTDPHRFRCNECQTSFVTKQALTKHLRRHTEDPEIRPYACEYEGCNSTFKQKDHVRIHIRRTHEKSDDVFACEICAKSYNRKDALSKHLRKSHNIVKKTRYFPVNT